MAGEEQPLTHEEVWDDSYLQDSWNDAVQEYEKYHSLASKGLSGNALIAELRAMGDEVTEAKIEAHINGVFQREEAPREITVDEAMDDEYEPIDTTIAPSAQQTTGQNATVESGRHGDAVAGGNVASSALPEVAQQLAAQVKDEGVKNLVMSWYFAGYYTGLHEAQQQHQHQQGNGP